MNPPNDVSLEVFEAAVKAGATHLSADGSRCYFDTGLTAGGIPGIFEAVWDDEQKDFGNWKVIDELPADAVEMD